MKGPRDVEPCAFGLVSWFRRPCSRAPSHETEFSFSLQHLHRRFCFYPFTFFLSFFIAWWCCCVVAVVERTCAFFNVETDPRNKIRRTVFAYRCHGRLSFSSRSCFGIE